MTILEALKRLRDDLKLWVSNNIRSINENIEQVKAELDKKPTMGDDEISGSLTIDADTLNGYTAAQIIAQSGGGSSSGGGNVSYDAGITSVSDSIVVALKSSEETKPLAPRTTVNAVEGLQTQLTSLQNQINNISAGGGGGEGSAVLPTTVMTYYKGNSAPTTTTDEEKFAIIWFDTTHSTTNRCYIKLWNGVSWEVMNSWQ